MGIAKNKRIRKYLKFFRLAYGFHAPYLVLVDGDFVKKAQSYKVNLKTLLPKILNSAAHPLITNCVVSIMKSQGDYYHPDVKSIQVEDCNHSPTLSSSELCFKSLLQKGKYVIASQNNELKRYFQQPPNVVPILSFLYNQICLLPPSGVSYQSVAQREEAKVAPTEAEKQIINKEIETLNPPKTKKRKRKGGPNPLSVKKKKPKNTNITAEPPKKKVKIETEAKPDKTATEKDQKKKRRRKRKKTSPISGKTINTNDAS